eukprot:TRINITY_DN4909_c0_g1_i1.p1 TRINITY_DN4909_c0_g1~~TRINITY_DN4909_c0_g1_i1.p1  ORF type:complete len:448 (-),score=130.22 TRINITY_DN4909_c0_g1_i1:487-1830(-)
MQPLFSTVSEALALYLPRPTVEFHSVAVMELGVFPSSSSSCVDCPPPEFFLPPPPIPSWLMDDPEACASVSDLSRLETCDSTLIIDAAFRASYSSISAILVCSLLLVSTLLLTSFLIFRRRKNSSDYPSDNSCHQISDHSMVYEEHRSSTPVSSSSGAKQQQQHASLSSALSSLKRNTLENNHFQHPHHHHHLESHFPNSTSLPNHYIPESHRQRGNNPRPLDPIRDLSTRFPPSGTAKRVTLSERPPAEISGGLCPHILIGGQPFYLIPSGGAGPTTTTEAYAYASTDSNNHPPPIYEEIDSRGEGGGSYYYSNSVGSAFSDRGEVGSLQRSEQDHPRFPSSGRHLPKRSPSNSVYYYSDTLRKPPGQQCFRISSSSNNNNKTSDDSDSGISSRSLAPTPKSSSSSSNNNNNNISSSSSSSKAPIETRVVIPSAEQPLGLRSPAEV